MRIWDESVKETAKDGEIFLRLVKTKDNDILLAACDKDGKGFPGCAILAIDAEIQGIVLFNGIDTDAITCVKTDLYGSALTIPEDDYVHDRKKELMTSAMQKLSEKIHEAVEKSEKEKNVTH